jgi:hypothetical protein
MDTLKDVRLAMIIGVVYCSDKKVVEVIDIVEMANKYNE